MARTILTTLLLVTLVACVDSPRPRLASSQVMIEEEPDTIRARPLGRWPNDADLARLESIEDKSKGVILRVLGHPSRVERRPDGEETWYYPWAAACYVSIRNGICTGTFYTAGF